MKKVLKESHKKIHKFKKHILKNKYLVALGVVLLIISFGVLLNFAYKNENQNKLQKTSTSVDKEQKEVFSFENLLEEKLRKKEESISLTPNKGFFITTSILSHKRDKIVYAELSDCAKNQEPGGIDCWNNFDFNIYIKNLITNKTEKIYPYPDQKFTYLLNLIFHKVMAGGGCKVVPFPIAWSINDKKIILEWGNPTTCGSGGAPEYKLYTIDVATLKFEGIAPNSYVLVNNNKQVVYTTDSSTKCTDKMLKGADTIVIKEVESGIVKTIVQERNSYILRLETDTKNLNILNYKVYATKYYDGVCTEIDLYSNEKSKSVNLKKFFK